MNKSRRDETRSMEDRIERQVAEAVRMLGEEASSTKIAGVYALANIADKYKREYKQLVVDVLCGYIRTPRSNDKAVESTITNVIKVHLLSDKHNYWKERSKLVQQINDDELWCECNFDFHEVVFNDYVSWDHVTFAGEVSFYGAKFLYYITFDGSFFMCNPSFRNTEFSQSADFGNVEFHDHIGFLGTKFQDDADFHNSFYAYGVYFDYVEFSGNVDFCTAEFKISEANDDTKALYKVDSERNPYSAHTSFRETDFYGDAKFSEATFYCDVRFSDGFILGKADFSQTIIKTKMEFVNIDFVDDIDVSDTPGIEFISCMWKGQEVNERNLQSE